MITDFLHNYKTYLPLHPRFARAFAYLTAADLSQLPEGRTDIEGDEIFIMVSRGELRRAEDAPIEVHDRYIDIQVVIEGAETYGWKERSALVQPRGGFDAESDIQFFDDAPSLYYTARAEQMSIFFPEDGHAPLIGSGSIFKCVVKVLK